MVPFSARPLILLGLAVLVPRLVLAVALGVAGRPEWWEYDVIAANLAQGNGHTYDRLGFVYAAYAPPLWSGILAALLGLPGATRASIQVTQALLCLGATFAIAALARRISGDARVGLLAGLLVALQPSLLYYSVVKSDPLPLNACLLGMIAVSAIELAAGPTDRRAVTFGILAGLGVLSRGTPVVALPLVGFALLTRWKGAGLGPAVVAVVASTLCIAPWAARNLWVLGSPLLTSTTGENFWRGNHEGAGGGVVDLDGGDVTKMDATNEALPQAIREVLRSGTELDRHHIFMDEGLRFIREEPWSAARLFARKMRTFWWRIDSAPLDYSPEASIAYEATYRLELALSIFGAFVVFRRSGTDPGPDRGAAALVLAIMIAISVLQSAFYVQGRHRFLVEPLLLTFTACGLATLAGRLKPTGSARSAP